MAPKSICKFQQHWLTEDCLYQNWIQESKLDTEAYCKICKKFINLSGMGESALKSHVKSDKHAKLIAAKNKTPSMTNFFNNPSSSKSVLRNKENIADETPEQQQPSENVSTAMHKYVTSKSVTVAETLWCLEVVMTHSSLRTGSSGVNLFPVMFPDSEIAKAMRLAKDKIKYMVTYGISVYFADELAKDVSGSPFYSVSFDESLNKTTQCGQMDIHVRFMKGSVVVTRYLTSVFLNRGRAEDLLEAFNEGVSKLDQSKILQVSMDGPNVNHKFLRLFIAERGSNLPPLLDCGICSLHVISGCLKYADEKGDFWNVGKFLSAIYYVFRDSPMRRALFLEANEVSQSDFPMKFCPTRWVENTRVAQRAMNLLPKLKRFVEKISNTREEPKSASYVLMKTTLANKLLPAKIAFFLKISSELEVFLVQYQTESPMMPFLHDDLSVLLSAILIRFIKKDLVEGKSFKQLSCLDLTNELHQLPAENLDLGFAVKEEIRKVRGELTKNDILQLRKEAMNFLVAVVTKINDRSPLKYLIVKGFTCFNPSIMLKTSKYESRVDILLKELVSIKKICGKEADDIKSEFKRFVSDPNVQQENKKYSRETRLDVHFDNIFKLPTFNVSPLFKRVVGEILCLTHGQAAVERGFNINKEILVENLQEKSLIAQRIVHDAVVATGKPVTEFKVTPSLIQAVRNSSRLYKEDLENKKKLEKSINDLNDRKRRADAMVREKEEEKKRMRLDLEAKMSLIDQEIVSLRHE